MSTQRFSPEFKEEAVRQVLEQGHSIAEVGARLGVSMHSLHKGSDGQGACLFIGAARLQ